MTREGNLHFPFMASEKGEERTDMSASDPSPSSSSPAMVKDEQTKKAAREARKKEKEKEKEAKKVLRQQEQQQYKPPHVQDIEQELYGVLPRVQSQRETGRTWTHVQDIDSTMAGRQILVRGHIHTSRAKGKTCFLVIRQEAYTIQGALFVTENGSISKEFIKYAGSVPLESVVDVEGIVNTPQEPIKSTSQENVEIHVTRMFTVATAQTPPINVEDASRNEEEAQTKGLPTVNLDTRLDNRVIDLRTKANQGIFRIQSGVCQLFREFLLSKRFVEIHTPKMIGAASEGGANVFKIKYFDRDAYLAQSPQLYKQMAVMSDLERVFEIGPVFRAENSNTHRHMTEFVGLDMEMAIKDHYNECLEVLGECFVHIFDGILTRFASEVEFIRSQYPIPPLVYHKKTLILHFPEGIKMLHEAGFDIGELEDLSTIAEKTLGKLVKEKYDTDFYILDRYPLSARPFYTMPCPDNADLSNSYDFFIRGEEIVSGAQRIHDPELLLSRAEQVGANPTDLRDYIDSFKYGSVPHAGAGVGLERVVMLFFGLGNIRRSSMFPRDPQRLHP